MAPHRLAVLLMILPLSLGSWAGEIIFVDPVREKAQSLQKQPESQQRGEQVRERVLEDARQHGGGKPGEVSTESLPTPAEIQSQNARGYLDDDEPPISPPVLMKNPEPVAEAAKVRQAARTWATPAVRKDTRCTTENTVGGIDGTVQGHTTVQGSGSGAVNIQCK